MSIQALQHDINETRNQIVRVQNQPWTSSNPIFSLSEHLALIQNQLRLERGEDVAFTDDDSIL
jgi:hypothetical protein